MGFTLSIKHIPIKYVRRELVSKLAIAVTQNGLNS